jgi:hypothetical protein
MIENNLSLIRKLYAKFPLIHQTMSRRVVGPNGVVPSDGQHSQSVQIFPGKGIAFSKMLFRTAF